MVFSPLALGLLLAILRQAEMTVLLSVPFGKKLMLIAKRGRASRRLESLFTSVDFAIADCLSKPPSKLMKDNVKFYHIIS